MEALTHDERVAVARLRALLELLPTALDRHLTDAGLTSFEFSLLEALFEADHHRLRLTALAARTNATLPRLSRVVTGLEKKGLVGKAACEQDGRATNAVLTDSGERAYLDNRPHFENAVREMILSALDPGGVQRLADISYAILSKLDPDRRLAVTTDGSAEDCDADPRRCAADPAPRRGS
ncbi:DNA-binding MarR family transcriptional regulator [Microbacterium sp. SORGH_AS 888]|nr:MarR family transcriptional regulator [Microbacterium sp. SORGH_AS_0888]MDQ1130704.1 DNA-binding MarR family transcriptional regulator [Microbacterium sp. SORGH_AS_0888]